MPLARGAEADDHPLMVPRQLGLVGMLDNRRIEKRSRFNGILHGEIGADQHLQGFRQIVQADIHVKHYRRYAVEVMHENLLDAAMPHGILTHHLAEQLLCLEPGKGDK